MEPPPFGSGNWQGRKPLQNGCQFASMEPPPFGSGNRAMNRSSSDTRWSLQWSHRLSAVETAVCDVDGLEGIVLQWSHRLSAVETRRTPRRSGSGSRSFNGATAFRQWKRHLVGHTISGYWGASMEPPPFGSGNSLWGGGQRIRSSASMEPPPFGSGNSIQSPVPTRYWRSLQWSHRLSAVETRLGLNRPLKQTLLQWSHRLSAVETTRGVPSRGGPSACFNGATAFRQWKLENRLRPLYEQMKLQWSHRLSAVETACGVVASGFGHQLQWSHRLSAVETLSSRRFQHGTGGRFNGATAFRQWKLG